MSTSWDRVKEGLDKALEVTRKSAKIIADKAGETAKISKLSVEAMSLEHQMSKKFAELGNLTFRSFKSKKEGALSSLSKVKTIVEELKKLEGKLEKNHKTMESEKRKK